MKYTIYQIDAFTDQLFSGNPAAVIPLPEWLDESILLHIASENNLSETAFYVNNNNTIEIRWFTPTTEIDLCGHATLATAYVLKTHENFEGEKILFYSHRSGHLPVSIHENSFTMNFPSDTINEIQVSDELISTTNFRPIQAFKGKTDYMLVFNDQKQIEEIKPNFSMIQRLDGRGLIVTAKGNDSDFVSRFFAPQCGINEDPVTGSAHTTLTPYWATVLNKNELKAIQLSARKGKLICSWIEDRVEITGQAILYMKGQIQIQHEAEHIN